MLEELKKLRQLAYRSHYYCEDSWYSCPKAIDGCSNDLVGDECNCGASDHNKLVDLLYGYILEGLTNKEE